MFRGLFYLQTQELLTTAWPDVYHDMNEIKKDLRKHGYTILVLHPGQVTISEPPEKFGFLVLVPNNEARRFKRLLKRCEFTEMDIEGGIRSKLVVFIAVLRDPRRKRAILFPLYYHKDQEPQILEKGRTGLYSTFRVLSGEVVAVADLENYELFSTKALLQRE